MKAAFYILAGIFLSVFIVGLLLKLFGPSRKTIKEIEAAENDSINPHF